MAAVPLQLRREQTLRTRATRGDENAFAALYQRHHQALYRYCRSILRHDHDAQDALQSTMARAFAALKDERRDIDLRPWLFRIAHNEAITIVRRRKASAELTDIPDVGDLDDRIADREALRNLRLDLADLPERQRAALVLRELNGLSHAEIGAVLEISPSAVKQSIFEARSALFSCREGRDIACGDIQRMLSDGDGRVLRGRGVRAHLRMCPECRAFRAELDQRPRALRALAPPLPVGGAAALVQLMVGGGTAAKLVACVALVGGGTTLAAEMHVARQPGKPAEAAAATTPKRTPTPVGPVATVVVAPASAQYPTRAAERRAGPVKKAARPHRKAARPARPAKPAKAFKSPKPFKPHQPVKAKPGKPIAQAEKRVAKVQAKQVAIAERQLAQVERRVAKAEKRVAKAEKRVAKAQAKQVATAQAKQGESAEPDKKPH